MRDWFIHHLVAGAIIFGSLFLAALIGWFLQ